MPLAAPYAPRQPTTTPLHRIVRAALETFLGWTRETYRKPIPRYVEQDLRGYLRCGVFAHGFVRAHCDDCGHDLLVAFSCKGRGVCPSCAGRRMANTAAHLVDRVLPDVPLRQYVLSLPFELRRLAAFDPKVLTALARIFAGAIFASHKRRSRGAGLERAVASGAVTCVQRFGGSLNLNVHFHTIVIDGVFVREPDGELGFVALPEPTRDELHRLVANVARRALAWLRRHGHLTTEPSSTTEPTALDACVAFAMQRIKLQKLDAPPADESDDPEPPSLAHRAVEEAGFNLHAGVRVRDDLERERLCRYALRPAIPLSRVRRLRDGRVAFRVKRADNGGRAKHMILTPLEFLARAAALVPPPRYPLVRYHGVLAPRSSWRRLVVPKPPSPRPCATKPPNQTVTTPAKANKSSTPKTHTPNESVPSSNIHLRVERLAPNVLATRHWDRLDQGLLYTATPRLDWPRLLRRTFEVDVLQCPRCAGRLRVLAIVTDPSSLAQILPALGLPADAPIISRARDPTDLFDFDHAPPPAYD